MQLAAVSIARFSAPWGDHVFTLSRPLDTVTRAGGTEAGSDSHAARQKTDEATDNRQTKERLK